MSAMGRAGVFLLVAVSAGAGACTRSGSATSGEERIATRGPEIMGNSPYTKPEGIEEAVLAGGCFWGMEEILRAVPGIVDTEVGYTGGTTPSPRYRDVKTGETGHAEAIRIYFDPKKISYDEILDEWFFRMHDPTTRNRQGNDRGTQYRSAIFVTSPEQRRTAEAARKRAGESGRWRAPIVTEIFDAGAFTPAEEEHQDYLQKHPGGYTCHFMRD
jgi:peptide methionine sulfoxide reductase msrA/msrB